MNFENILGVLENEWVTFIHEEFEFSMPDEFGKFVSCKKCQTVYIVSDAVIVKFHWCAVKTWPSLTGNLQ